MKYLVTGASGFVGAALVEYLAKHGQHVVGVDRIPPPLELMDALGESKAFAKFVEVDLLDRRGMQNAFSSSAAEVVIHTAAVTASEDRDRSDPHSIIDVNVGGVATVMQCCREKRIEKIILVSSSAAYGQRVFQQDSLLETEFSDPVSMYEITKFASERVGLRLGSLYGIDVKIARLSTVYGPWERATGVRDTLSPIIGLSRFALSGGHAVLERPGYRDWIYVRDAVRAIVALLELSNTCPKIYNVGPGDDRRWAISNWAELLRERFNGFDFHLAEDGEQANVFLHQKADRASFNIERLKKYTKFEPQYDLEQSFNDYMEWLQRYPNALAG